MAAEPRPETFIVQKRLLSLFGRGLAVCLKSRGRPPPLTGSYVPLVPAALGRGPISSHGQGADYVRRLCEGAELGRRAPSSLVTCYLITGSVISWSLWLGMLMGLLVAQEGQAESCIQRKLRVCGRLSQGHSRNGTRTTGYCFRLPGKRSFWGMSILLAPGWQ